MGWHYKKWNREIGPVDDGELERLFADGEIHKGTLVRPEGGAEWVRYDKRHEPPPAPPEPSPPPQAEQGGTQKKPEAEYVSGKTVLVVLALTAGAVYYMYNQAINNPPSTASASYSSSAFARAISGERWTINDDNIVVLAHPKVPGSQEEMMNNLVTALSPGAQVEVLETGWGMVKVNVLDGSRAYAQGWIVAHTVDNAVQR